MNLFLREVSASIIGVALLGQALTPAYAQSTAQNTAQGSITVDGKKTELRHAYSYRKPEQGKDKAEALLILSDKPLPPDSVIDKLDRIAARNKDNVQMIEVTFNDAREIEAATFRLDALSGIAFASAFKTTFDAFSAQALKGRLMTAGEQKSFGRVYNIDVRFEAIASVPRVPDAVGKKAWDTAQGKVFAAYLRAVQAGDKAAVKRAVVPEVAQGLDTPEAERALKAMKTFAADPKHADIEGLFVSGDTTTLKLVEVIDGHKAYSSKTLRKVGDAWLVVP